MSKFFIGQWVSTGSSVYDRAPDGSTVLDQPRHSQGKIYDSFGAALASLAPYFERQRVESRASLWYFAGVNAITLAQSEANEYETYGHAFEALRRMPLKLRGYHMNSYANTDRGFFIIDEHGRRAIEQDYIWRF